MTVGLTLDDPGAMELRLLKRVEEFRKHASDVGDIIWVSEWLGLALLKNGFAERIEAKPTAYNAEET